VPFASLLKDYTGSWHSVFVVATAMNLFVAFLALFVLKPMRHRKIEAETAKAQAHALETA